MRQSGRAILIQYDCLYCIWVFWKGYTHTVRLYMVYMRYCGRVIHSTTLYTVYEAIWKGPTHRVHLSLMYIRQSGRAIHIQYDCLYCIWVILEGPYSYSTHVYTVYEAEWKGHTHTLRLYMLYMRYCGTVIHSTLVYTLHEALWKGLNHTVHMYKLYMKHCRRVIHIQCSCIYHIRGTVEVSYKHNTPVCNVYEEPWKGHTMYPLIYCIGGIVEGSYSHSMHVYTVFEAVWKVHTHTVRMYILYKRQCGRFILTEYVCIYCIRSTVEGSYLYSTPVYTVYEYSGRPYRYSTAVNTVCETLWNGHTDRARLYILYMRHSGRPMLIQNACIYCIWGSVEGSYW
jgi:hypothetical protein